MSQSSVPELDESKISETVRDVIRLSDLALAPLFSQGDAADRNKLLLIASLIFLVASDFVVRDKVPGFSYVRPEYLILALALAGTFYFISLIASGWRAWQRRLNNRRLIRSASRAISLFYEAEREKYLKLAMARQNEVMDALAKQNAFYEASSKFANTLVAELQRAESSWRAKLSLEVQRDMKGTQFPYRISGTDELRASLHGAIDATMPLVGFLDDANRVALVEFLRKSVDEQIADAECGHHLIVAKSGNDYFGFIQNHRPEEQTDKAVAVFKNVAAAIKSRFRSLTELLRLATEPQAALVRSDLLAFWWDLTFPIALFVFAVSSASSQIMAAMLSVYFGMSQSQ